MNRQTLGDVLRRARVARGVSLRSLSSELEITPSYLSDIENDRRTPSEDVLIRMAHALEIHFEELMQTAGRLGENVERFIKDQPLAVQLFRTIADAKPDDTAVRRLIEQLEKEKPDKP